MSRVHYFSFIADDHGHPLPGAKVSIFLAGTETPAKIFTTEFGSVYISEDPQLTTTSKGFFEFWIADLNAPDGYGYGQKFKIRWEKPGVSTGYIDWIDIFPNINPVDETNFESVIKDKLVSDRLAYNWETHREHDVRTDFFPIHGLENFNPKGDSNSIEGNFTANQEQINKVISDKFAYIWDNHSEFSFDDMIALSSYTSGTSATSSTYYTSGSSGDGWLSTSYPDIYNNTAHGLKPAQLNDDDDHFNRLVSNKFLQNFAGSKKINITISEWTLVGSEYKKVVTHNLDDLYPNVTVWNTDTKEIEGATIISIDESSFEIWVSIESNLHIKVSK